MESKMIPIEEAGRLILAHTEVLEKSETDILSSYGFVLADDVQSDIDMPPFDKAAMDGYAVRSGDCENIPATLSVKMSIPAGACTDQKIGPGECAKIMTGAPVPHGADSVVMVEDTQPLDGMRVKILKEVKQGRHICRKGEDVGEGELLLSRGAMIGAPEVAILASAGRATVPVYRRPKVSVISTGSEIVEPGEPLGKGRIRNSNGPMLMNMVKAEGCEARYLGIAGDTEGELESAIERGSRSDVILLSGGVSMGDYDLVPAILKKTGASIIFHKVSVKPGKPLLFAKRKRCIIFGIPGNPVSNFTTFHLFVKPALRKLMGDPFHEISLKDAVSEVDIENKGDRVHVMPSVYTMKKGGIYVKPLKLNGSADIVGCAAANCLSVLKGGGTRVEQGETVNILILK